MAKVVVEIPHALDDRYKAWGKVLTGVDMSAIGGYSFEGDFIRLGHPAELDIGRYILV